MNRERQREREREGGEQAAWNCKNTAKRLACVHSTLITRFVLQFKYPPMSPRFHAKIHAYPTRESNLPFLFIRHLPPFLLFSSTNFTDENSCRRNNKRSLSSREIRLLKLTTSFILIQRFRFVRAKQWSESQCSIYRWRKSRFGKLFIVQSDREVRL